MLTRNKQGEVTKMIRMTRVTRMTNMPDVIKVIINKELCWHI